ncbi:hypothetical protein M0804_010738 [Polistes exclamans]|nr:hypothetical protein M0804_010738 [Polistes exclamans]
MVTREEDGTSKQAKGGRKLVLLFDAHDLTWVTTHQRSQSIVKEEGKEEVEEEIEGEGEEEDSRDVRCKPSCLMPTDTDLMIKKLVLIIFDYLEISPVRSFIIFS